MIKVLPFNVQQGLGLLIMLVIEGFSENVFLNVFLTTYFGVRNDGNTSAMTVIFFEKWSKFNVDFKNAEKDSEKVFLFLR